MSRKYIKQLTVGGFQVFADPVTIPLGPLTLIYGPNSAGKSAILDAMLALADLCDLRVPMNRSSAPSARRIDDVLGRHWRRESAMPAAPAKSLRLGATIRVAAEEWAEAGFATRHLVGIGPLKPAGDGFADCFQVLQPLATAEHVDVDVSIAYRLSKRGSLSLGNQAFAQEHCIDIGLGGSPILRFHEPAGLASINLDHAALLDWNTAADLRWAAGRYEGGFAVDGGWLGMRLSGLLDGWLSTNSVDYVEPLLPPGEIHRVRDAEASFISMFDALFRSSLRSMSDTLRVPLVPASRAVPNRSELTFLFDADATPLPRELIGLQDSALQEHLEITRAAFISELERCGIRTRPEGWFGENLKKPSKDPVDLVNRLLSEYLFQSSGYFVAAGVNELTPLGASDNDDMGENTNNAGRKFLASLELRDAAGRRFNFDDVGSGLGYVLPVLLAVATFDAAFLQQPELHLHPALQSELADALIAALGDSDFGGPESKGCEQIIAETHSEHLLLRLLRRVRQAADPDRFLDPHAIGREDVVVLYVDPRPDGASTVKHLRIARDGEFIDRWPRGFFEERWGELFDE